MLFNLPFVQLLFHLIFLQCISSPSEITTNVYLFSVSSCSAFLLLPVTSQAHSWASVKYYCEQKEALLHVYVPSASLKRVFSSLQSRGIWAAPLMTVFADGSGTKTGTCTGRQHRIHLVIEGQGSFIQTVLGKLFILLSRNENEKSFFSLLTCLHRQEQAALDKLSSSVLFYSITGQDENYLRKVVCLFCRLVLCSTKRCKWELDYSTRQWYL